MLLMCMTFEMNATYRYRLYLNGKPGSDYCDFSDRSKIRRSRQNIELDETDKTVSPYYINTLREAGLQIVVSSRWMNTIVVCSPKEEMIEDDFWGQFSFVDSVKCVAKNIVETRSLRRKNRLAKTLLSSDDNYMMPHLEIGVDALYEHGYKGNGKLVAILDAGYANVKKLTTVNKNVIGYYDMYNPCSEDGVFGEEIHGTCCLSIMASDGSLPILGSAPEAEYFLIKTEDPDEENPLEEDMWIAGAEFADSIGADLINSSLGYFEFDDESFNYSQSDLGKGVAFVTKGADVAANKGMIVCVAAGNERQTDWNVLNFPADSRDVLSVGGTSADLSPSLFTSVGFTSPYVKPDVACRATKAYVLYSEDLGVARGDGTSFSTPLMCGACASLWSAAPDLSARQIVEIVRCSGRDYASPGELLGFGIPDFRVSLSMAEQMTSLKILEHISPADKDVISDMYGRVLVKEPDHGLFLRGGRRILK